MIRFNNFKTKNGNTINLSIKKGDFVFFYGDYSSEILELFYDDFFDYKDELFFDTSENLKFGRDIVFLNNDIQIQLDREVLYSFKLPFYLHSSSMTIFKSRLYKLLAESALLSKLSQKVYLLDGVEYKQLLYFRSLINNPDIFIIDNFFSDIPEEAYLSSLKKLNQSGVTILMSGSKFVYNYFKEYFTVDLVEV